MQAEPSTRREFFPKAGLAAASPIIISLAKRVNASDTSIDAITITSNNWTDTRGKDMLDMYINQPAGSYCNIRGFEWNTPSNTDETISEYSQQTESNIKELLQKYHNLEKQITTEYRKTRDQTGTGSIDYNLCIQREGFGRNILDIVSSLFSEYETDIDNKEALNIATYMMINLKVSDIFVKEGTEGKYNVGSRCDHYFGKMKHYHRIENRINN